jgi:hypothetical protein
MDRAAAMRNENRPVLALPEAGQQNGGGAGDHTPPRSNLMITGQYFTEQP